MTTPLLTLVQAATTAKAALGLKYRPIVFRNGELAQRCADRSKCDVVMLGDGAFWIVCMADADRLERAGYEFAPIPALS